MDAIVSEAESGDRLSFRIASMPLLDWLRFVLASIVALEHQGIVFPAPITGGLAVDVFLALSGWLVGGILLRTPRAEMPRFYFNRATRVWGPYLFAILALYSVAAVKEGVDSNWVKYLFYDLSFTHYTFTVFPQAAAELPLDGTGNHFWSLSVEEQFYLLVPLAILLPAVGSRTLMWVAAVLAMVLIGGKFVPIAFGVMAAIGQFQFGNWHKSERGRVACATAVVVSGAGLVWMYSVFLAGVFAVSLVLLLSAPGRRDKVGIFLGAVSFPLYLNAWIGVFVAHILLRYVSLPDWISEIVIYGASLAGAVVCWWLVDRPIMKYRGGWYSRPLGISLGAAAYSVVAIGLLGGFLMSQSAA